MFKEKRERERKRQGEETWKSGSEGRRGRREQQIHIEL